MHEFHGGSHLMLPSTILAVLSGPALSLIFLFTEGVPQVVIYRLIKKRFPSPRTKKRNAQRTPSSVAYRELTTNSYQYVRSSGPGDVDCEERSHDDDNEHDDEDQEHDAMTGDTVIVETSDPQLARRQSEVGLHSTPLLENNSLLFTFPREYFTYTKGGGFTNMVCTLMGIERSHGLLMVTADRNHRNGSSQQLS